MTNSIYRLLEFVYGQETADDLLPRIETLIEQFKQEETAVSLPSAHPSDHYFDETDSVLICYGDMVQAHGERPLRSLKTFLSQTVHDVIKTVHFLPFYPYSSDDGFSVIDYFQVDPNLGDWDDILAFESHFSLMFDAVINHISQHSDWFKGFLTDEAPYSTFFKVVDPATDLTAVFRPRALPLLTAVNTPSGTKHVWTTFSDDQIDLNYESPDLLIEVLRVLFCYVQKGARFIRLDAIGFMWKVPGTRSLHLPETHAIIQLMRVVLDKIAPEVVLITETNVPHKENISYFGDGENEAQMVYNFSLPPLTLHAFQTGNATYLTEWAKGLTLPSDKVSFFNFLASHDGIGVTPARGILPDEAIAEMAERVKASGGFVSYKTNEDGSQSAYELNINYLDALTVPDVVESNETVCRRFLASQAVMLALRGVPGIYFHSLFGSRNWLAGVEKTGRNRTINREKLTAEQLTAVLSDKTSLRHQVFEGYKTLLAIRQQEPAFHPNGEQTVLDVHPAVFGVERVSLNGRSHVICLQNVSNQTLALTLDQDGAYRDLLSGDVMVGENGRLSLVLAPYQVMWLKAG